MDRSGFLKLGMLAPIAALVIGDPDVLAEDEEQEEDEPQEEPWETVGYADTSTVTYTSTSGAVLLTLQSDGHRMVWYRNGSVVREIVTA